MKESSAYMARRGLFSSDMETERSDYTSRRTMMRESAERISLTKRVSWPRQLPISRQVPPPPRTLIFPNSGRVIHHTTGQESVSSTRALNEALTLKDGG